MAKNSTKAPAGSRKAKIQSAQKTQGGGANWIIVATVVVVVAIVVVVGGAILVATGTAALIFGAKQASSGKNALPTGVSELGAGYPAFQGVTAQSGAPTLDVYEDFQCPACKAFEDALGPTIEGLAQGGQVKLVYHVKNFLDDNLRNDSSTKAANAAFCASDAGKFQEFHDQVYANQPQEGDGFTDAQLKGFAEASGITGEALTTWQACYDAGKYVDYVNSVESTSFADGVRGTPTVRLDGKDVALSDISTPEKLTQAVENATS